MKLAGSSGAGQELKSRFAMPVLRFCSGAVLLLAGLYGALLCFFQTFALPEAETALIWSLPTTLLFLIIYIPAEASGACLSGRVCFVGNCRLFCDA